jgi:hypothetical protein
MFSLAVDQSATIVAGLALATATVLAGNLVPITARL